MSFHRVRNSKELDNLIAGIVKNKAALSSVVMEQVVDKEFASQDNATAQKPTTDAIAAVTQAVSDGLTKTDNRLDTIVQNLFDKNTNESIISLLQQIKPIVESSGTDLGQVLLTIDSLKTGSQRRQDDIIKELKNMPVALAKQVVSQNAPQVAINAQTADILTQLGQALSSMPDYTGTPINPAVLSSTSKTPVSATPSSPAFSTPSPGPPPTPYKPPASTTGSAHDPTFTYPSVPDGIQPVALPPGVSSSGSSSSSAQHDDDATNADILRDLSASLGSPSSYTDPSSSSSPVSPLVGPEAQKIIDNLNKVVNDAKTKYEQIEKNILTLTTGTSPISKIPDQRYQLLVGLIQHPSRTAGEGGKHTTKSGEIQPDGTLGEGKVDLQQLKQGKLVIVRDGKEVVNYSGDSLPVVLQILTIPSRKGKFGKDLPEDKRAITIARSILDKVVNDKTNTSGKYNDIKRLADKDVKDLDKDIKDAEKKNPPTGMGVGKKVPASTYKMAADGKFGAININPTNLQKLILTAHKNGRRICHLPCDYDLVELLTKRFNGRKKYSAESKELYGKLVKHAELPIATGSGKFKMIAAPAPAPKKSPPKHFKNAASPSNPPVRIYSDPEEVLQRLNVLLGERSAGNDSPDVSNEISQLLDWLWQNDHIDETEAEELARLGGLV